MYTDGEKGSEANWERLQWKKGGDRRRNTREDGYIKDCSVKSGTQSERKNRDVLPKLHASSTGACPTRSILFRNRAALYNGKINGPKVSRKAGRERAG